MRVLAIGSDRSLFVEDSNAIQRQIKYAAHFDALDIIVTTRGNTYQSVTREKVVVIPTCSLSVALYGFGILMRAMQLPRAGVITVQDPFEYGLIAALLAWLRGVPLHVQIHTDLFHVGFARSSVLNRVRRVIARLVLARATRIRVVLQKIKDDLVQRGYTQPIEVLPIYVDVQKFSVLPRIKHAQYKTACLFVGRLEKEKNARLAIDCVYAARKNGIDVGLTIVGEGSERSFLESYVQKWGLIGRVKFLGRVLDISEQLSTADIVLVPSRYEGYGLIIVEALAAHVPVLSNTVGVAKEAGALLSTQKTFGKDFLAWLDHGPRAGNLLHIPYHSEEEYIARYTADIAASIE
jgi:glycosyltransferase involved in cell wall biosynthesis